MKATLHILHPFFSCSETRPIVKKEGERRNLNNIYNPTKILRCNNGSGFFVFTKAFKFFASFGKKLLSIVILRPSFVKKLLSIAIFFASIGKKLLSFVILRPSFGKKLLSIAIFFASIGKKLLSIVIFFASIGKKLLSFIDYRLLIADY